MGPRRPFRRSRGAVLDASHGAPMMASRSHEGGEVFMRRALYFAAREIGERPRAVPLPATWLAYYLAYRAGMSVDAIAGQADVSRKPIALRIAAVIALMGHPEIRERIEALVAEMGRVNFESRGAAICRFPGPSRLATPHIREAV